MRRFFTECQHSGQQVARHLALERLLNGTLCHLLVLDESCAKLRVTVGAHDLVELGLVGAQARLAGLIQLLYITHASA